MGKKEDIINSARTLFTKYNFDKVSMDEIAKDAKVTKKTIYHYFHDKQELFQYFIEEELEHIHKKIEKVNKSNETFLEKISENLQNVLAINNDNKLLTNLIQDKVNNNLHNQSSFIVYETKIIDYLEKKIEEEIEKGNIKNCDARLTAFIIYKTIYSLNFEYDKSVDKKELINEVTEILTNGLLMKGEI